MFCSSDVLMAMNSMEGAHGLAEEIELCERLRNDIGGVLKFNARKAAKYDLVSATKITN